MLTMGNAATDALFQSGARQYAHLYLFDSAPPTEITDTDIMQNGVSIVRSAVSGDSLTIGSVVAADCTIRIYNRDGKYDNTQFLGNVIMVGILDKTGENGVSLGSFRIDTVTEENSIITIKGMDCMALLDVPYTSGDIAFPTLLQNMMLAVERKLIEVVGDGEIRFDPSDFGTNMDIFQVAVTIDSEPCGEFTYRQLFAWALQFIGKSAYADPMSYNTIKIGKFDYQDAGSLYKSHRIGSHIDKNSISINSVTVSGDQEWYGSVPVYNIDLGDNPLYDAIEDASGKETVRRTMHSTIANGPYYPMTATVLPCPLYMPFDLLRFYTDDTNYKRTFITDVVWTLNANVRLGSVGISTQTNSYAPNSPVTRQQADYIGLRITDYGTSGDWHYKKYADGTVEATAYISIPVTATARSTPANVYSLDGSVNLPSVFTSSRQKTAFAQPIDAVRWSGRAYATGNTLYVNAYQFSNTIPSSGTITFNLCVKQF